MRQFIHFPESYPKIHFQPKDFSKLLARICPIVRKEVNTKIPVTRFLEGRGEEIMFHQSWPEYNIILTHY